MGGTWVHRGLGVTGCMLMYVSIVVLDFTQVWELGGVPGPVV